MNDILVSIQLGLQIATTAVIAIGVLIVGIALVYRATDIAKAVINKADGGMPFVKGDKYYDFTEEEEEAYQQYLEYHRNNK